MDKLLQRYSGFRNAESNLSLDTIKALAAGLQLVHEDNLRRVFDSPYASLKRKALRQQYNLAVLSLKYKRNQARARRWFIQQYFGKRVRLLNTVSSYKDAVFTVGFGGILHGVNKFGRDISYPCPVSWQDVKNGIKRVEVVE